MYIRDNVIKKACRTAGKQVGRDFLYHLDIAVEHLVKTATQTARKRLGASDLIYNFPSLFKNIKIQHGGGK